MFEARMASVAVLKKLVDAIKDLLTEATWDVGENGLALQAMDSSHVALVSVKLEAQGFDEFRVDRTLSLGINLANMAKILKCAGNDDSVKMQCQDEGDTITFLFESANQERQSEFEIKLMDLDTEHLGIPDQEYDCVVKMPSAEFRRICTDLSTMGDSVQISCAKQYVQFQAKGDLGTGSIRLNQTANADDENTAVEVEVKDPVNVSFALKYLNLFCKAAPLGNRVQLNVSNEVPIVVEFPIEQMGYIKFYLAPKIEENEER